MTVLYRTFQTDPLPRKALLDTSLLKSLAYLTTYPHNCRRPLGRPDRRLCEKGGPMSDNVNPVFDYRREVQDYLRSCEHLLAAATTPPSLTGEELAMIGYYMAYIQKLLPVSDEN